MKTFYFVHVLKILPEYFKDVQTGIKSFELRKDDRNFQVGDSIILAEYSNGDFTGRECGPFRISYVLRNCSQYGLSDGYCILGFDNYYLP